MRRLLTALLFWPLAAFGTPYYVDLDAGNDGAAGTAIGTAWLTLGKATTTLTAGDVAYVRAATSEVIAADVNLTNDGTAASPIRVIGCDSVVNDPWSDGSDVLPLIDFNGAAYNMPVSGDDYWLFERIHFKNSHDTAGAIYFVNSEALHLDACKFEDNYYQGILTGAPAGNLLIENCTFLNNADFATSRSSIALYGGVRTYIYNTTFTPFSTNRNCIFLSGGGLLTAEACTFNQSTYGVSSTNGSNTAVLRDCVFVSSGVAVASCGTHQSLLDRKGAQSNAIRGDGWNFDGAALQKGRQWQFQYPGEIDSWTTYARSGGGTYGWRFQANANCAANTPLMLTYFVYVDDTDAHNYSMWCKFQADAFDKGADLDETEIGFYITELKGDGTIPQTAMGATTWDFDNTTTWQQGALTSFTASAAGTLRIDVFVASASGDVYIDPPVGEAGAGDEGYADGTLYYNIANVGTGGGGPVRRVGGVLAR